MIYDNFMTYQEYIVKFLSNFNDYVNTKYVLNKDMYTRSGGKWNLKTAIKYPICRG